ncbi:MAG: ATP-binding protein [Bacillota bacterium]|nr:ATP-binding protein [Bacillota bacterium]
MKANLIINLIAAHCSGIESEFKNALMGLADDEEKKGNVSLALQLKTTYKGGKKPKQKAKHMDIYPSSNVIIPQGVQSNVAPRDKDSLLELFDIINSDVRLDDVILPQKQKQAIWELIEEQKNAEKLLTRNIAPSNRLLLCGPPGCGKTMTAKAIAAELGLPIAYIRLDGLVSSYLGQTSTNLRKVFDEVRNQRIVLLLDEFDAIAKKRDDANELGELKRVVTTLLQNFDNMPSNVFLIAATNHQHLLDPAVWRRFNISIILNLPDANQREELISRWLQDYGVKAELNIDLLAKITEGLNGAQIQELVTAAAKNYFIADEKISTEEIVSILLRQLSFYSEGSEEFLNTLKRLKNNGVSMRTLEKATGIAKSTLSYKLKEGDSNE